MTDSAVIDGMRSLYNTISALTDPTAGLSPLYDEHNQRTRLLFQVEECLSQCRLGLLETQLIITELEWQCQLGEGNFGAPPAGKNPEERKARYTQALHNELQYQEARRELWAWTGRQERLTAAKTRLGHELVRLKTALRCQEQD